METNDAESEIIELYSFINSITYIDCEECKYQQQYEGDAFDCMDVIYEDGWRAINNKCLCKKCIDKLNKKS